jgi:hypothetical protein
MEFMLTVHNQQFEAQTTNLYHLKQEILNSAAKF